MFLGVPKKAKSLVLIMDDIDVPTAHRANGIWNHWLLWNIPAAIKGIGEGVTPPGIQGHTTGGEVKYQGPCPPRGKHRYRFQVYALDTMLDVDTETGRRQDVLKAMEGHVLDSAVLEGQYKKCLPTD